MLANPEDTLLLIPDGDSLGIDQSQIAAAGIDVEDIPLRHGGAETEIDTVLQTIAPTPAGTMVIVDSFGHLHREHLELLYKKYAKAMEESGKEIGIHAHNNMQLAFAKAPIGLCSFDSSLRFRHVNEFLATMNGLSVEAHLGRTVREVLPDLAAGIDEQLRYVLSSGEAIMGGEVEAETAAHPGEPRLYRHNYYAAKAQDGSVIGVSCVVFESQSLRTATSSQ